MNLDDLIAAVTAHNYLALAILVTLYVRKLVSDASRFPITIPPQWQPAVSASLGLVYGVLVALKTGAAFAAAVKMALLTAVAGGLLDAFAMGIFAHQVAPAWVRFVLGIIDDMAKGDASGGGGSVGPGPYRAPAVVVLDKQEQKTTPPAARSSLAVIAIALPLAMVAISLIGSGCGWLENPKHERALGDLSMCVLGAYEDANAAHQPIDFAWASSLAVKCGLEKPQDVFDLISAHKAAVAREKTIDAGAP